MAKKLIKFTLVFFAFLILILTISPILLDKKKIISAVNNKLKNELNLDINYSENLEISFFPFPELTLNDLVYRDLNGMSMKVNQIQITSTWQSLIKLDPNIKLVKLNSPVIKFKKKIVKNHKILVGNSLDGYNFKLKNFLKKFQNLKIKNGRFEFFRFNKLNILDNIEVILSNSGETKIKADLNYVNYESFIKFNAKTKNYININYSINQLFKNKNELFGSGEVNFDENQVTILGSLKSEKLNLIEISKLFALIKSPNSPNVLPASITFPKVNFNFNLEVDKILINKTKLDNMSLKVFSKKGRVFFEDFKANYLDSIINLNAVYSYNNNNFKGKASIYDFIVERDLLGDPQLDLKDASFDCDSEFLINDSNSKKFINHISATGDCIATNANLVGINVEKISNRVDNLETFQDFFDLFNKKQVSGNTIVDSINFSFKLKDSIFYLNDFLAFQENIKISSYGSYSIYEDNLNLKNDVFIKTNKYKNLPSFKIFVNGTSKDYKISYDFEKIKSAILNNGINSILKKKKKIVINPKEFKNLIDKNSKQFKPEKIIDLFLN